MKRWIIALVAVLCTQSFCGALALAESCCPPEAGHHAHDASAGCHASSTPQLHSQCCLKQETALPAAPESQIHVQRLDMAAGSTPDFNWRDRLGADHRVAVLAQAHLPDDSDRYLRLCVLLN